MNYKVLVDSITGRGGQNFIKGDLINENCLLNIENLIEIKAIELVEEKKTIKK